MKKKKILNKKVLLIIALILLSILIKYFFFSFESGDYKRFLLKWYNILDEEGLISIVNGLGNYNPPYLTLLYLLTFIPGPAIIKIKMLSVIFDILMGMIGFLIVKELTKEKHSYWAWIIILFLPTVILNSSMWAQCDSIYTTFVLLSLYLLIKEKYSLSFLSLGVAFSFKLQFIFILPLFIIIYVVNKKFSIFHFLLIPLGNILMCLPVLLMGMPLINCFTTYITQTTDYSVYLTRNLANVYEFLPNIKIIGYLLFIITGLLFLALLIYFLKRNKEISKKEIISIGLLSILIAVYFLPFMHERYMFMADVLSVVWYFIYKKKIYIPIIINLGSLAGYTVYLFGFKWMPLWIFSCLMLFAIISLLLDIMDKNNKLKWSKIPNDMNPKNSLTF